MALVHFNQLNPSGSLNITGSFSVQGQTILYQTVVSQSALIVSGAIDLVQAQINAEVQKAKITIENLGTIGDRDLNSSIDLGGFY